MQISIGFPKAQNALGQGFPEEKLTEYSFLSSLKISKYSKLYLKERKFNFAYIRYRFIRYVNPGSSEQPLCLLCLTKLAADTMRPCKLKRHLQVAHPKHVDDTVEMFERRAQICRVSTLDSHRFQSLEKPKRQASYIVSLLK